MSTKRARSHIAVLGRARFGRLEPPTSVVSIILSFASPDSFIGYHSVVGVSRTWLTASQTMTVMHIDPPPGMRNWKEPPNYVDEPYFKWETMLRALRKFPKARDVHLGLTILPDAEHMPLLCGSAAVRQSLARLVSVTIAVSSAYKSAVMLLQCALRLHALRSDPNSSLYRVCEAFAGSGMQAVIRRPCEAAFLHPRAADRRIVSFNGVAPVHCSRCGCYSVSTFRCLTSGCPRFRCGQFCYERCKERPHRCDGRGRANLPSMSRVERSLLSAALSSLCSHACCVLMNPLLAVLVLTPYVRCPSVFEQPRPRVVVLARPLRNLVGWSLPRQWCPSSYRLRDRPPSWAITRSLGSVDHGSVRSSPCECCTSIHLRRTGKQQPMRIWPWGSPG